MNKNILLTLLLFSSFVNAGVESLTWVVPTEREDNTKLVESEIAGFRIYYGVESDNYNNSITINDGYVRKYDLILPDGINHYIVITTFDKDGRESQYSTELASNAFPIKPVKIPNTISDFKIVQIRGTLNYKFTYTDPTTYTNGDLLPNDAIIKRFIFGNNKWIKDIKASEKSFILTLAPGYYKFEMEVEIFINNQHSVSKRSTMIVINVLSPPKPPGII